MMYQVDVFGQFCSEFQHNSKICFWFWLTSDTFSLLIFGSILFGLKGVIKLETSAWQSLSGFIDTGDTLNIILVFFVRMKIKLCLLWVWGCQQTRMWTLNERNVCLQSFICQTYTHCLFVTNELTRMRHVKNCCSHGPCDRGGTTPVCSSPPCSHLREDTLPVWLCQISLSVCVRLCLTLRRKKKSRSEGKMMSSRCKRLKWRPLLLHDGQL